MEFDVIKRSSTLISDQNHTDLKQIIVLHGVLCWVVVVCGELRCDRLRCGELRCGYLWSDELLVSPIISLHVDMDIDLGYIFTYC